MERLGSLQRLASGVYGIRMKKDFCCCPKSMDEENRQVEHLDMKVLARIALFSSDSMTALLDAQRRCIDVWVEEQPRLEHQLLFEIGAGDQDLAAAILATT
jgi:hypothetical protein